MFTSAEDELVHSINVNIYDNCVVYDLVGTF